MTLSALLLGSLTFVFAGCEESGVQEPAAASVTGSAVTPASAVTLVDEDQNEDPAKKEAQKNQPAQEPPADDPQENPPARSGNELTPAAAAGHDHDHADELQGGDGDALSEAIVVVEPRSLELGEIPTNDAGRGVVRLVNTGDVARSVVKCSTSCGCTAVNCPTGKVINPGEEVEIEVKLDGGARDGAKLNKTVTFLLSDGHPPVQLSVAAEAVAFVTIEPQEIDPDLHSDGRMVLTAIDGQPFTIKSMFPPMIEEFTTEPATEHVIYFPWEKWYDEGHRQRKLLFALDHPKCSKVYGQVSIKGIPQPERTPVGERVVTTTGIDLDKILMNKNDDEALQLLLDGRIVVGVADKSGQTPLIKAARWGRPAVMQALLDASADIEQIDNVGRTPLMYACQSKNAEAVRVLLESGADVHVPDKIGNTALCWASGFGDPEIVTMLLGAGAEVDVDGGLTGFTPLIWASGFGDPKIIQMLLSAGADLEAKDKLQDARALMHAARTGGADNVAVLIVAGADLEAVDREGKTALLVACSNAGGDVEVVKMLIDAGADTSRTTHSGKNALELARSRTDLRAADVEQYLTEVIGVARTAEEANAGTE